MTPRHLIVALAPGLLPAACSTTPYLPPGGAAGSTTSAPWVSPWAAEAQALRHVVALPNLAFVALVLAALWLLGRVARDALRFAWRLGADPNRRLASWLGWAQLAATAIVLSMVVVRLLDAAPDFGLWTLALTTGAMVLVLGRPLQSVWSGQLLRLRLRLREGDRISVAGHAGVVREIGLLRVELLCENGTVVIVPNRVVAQEVVTVEPGRGTASVRVRVPIEQGSLTEAAERLRRAALMSPYRAPGSPIVVTREDTAKTALVEMQAWSFDAVRAAEGHLARALEEQARAGEPMSRPRNGEPEAHKEP